MAFAAVTSVNLKGRDQAEGLKLLSEVMVPRLKALPGFQTARFMRSQDGSTGVGAVIFDTESHANAGLDALKDRPAEAPEVESSGIYEVVMEV